MDGKRRFFLKAFVPGALLASAGLFTLDSYSSFGQQSGQQPSRIPQNPDPMRPPTGKLFPTPTPAELRKNGREIKKDVDQLFDLAQDLKRQAAKDDVSQELSVGLIEKTQEIEKLAKKIRDLARY